MDIVDAQIHMGPIGAQLGSPASQPPAGAIESTLEAMNAIGVQSVLIDEFWYWAGRFDPEKNLPGFELPNGAWRTYSPIAQLASILHPYRFSYFIRIDRRDPQLESLMRVSASDPHMRAFRVLPVRTGEEAANFIKGAYDEIFALAEDIGLPMSVFTPGYVEYLSRYLKKFPKLKFIIDHWGMGIQYNMTGRPEAEYLRSFAPEYFNEILKLAEHPNVAIKTSHAHMHFGDFEYPFKTARARVRQAIEAFGADRILWSTDKSVAQPLLPWAELLFYLKDDPELSQDEKEKILGKNARRIFNWPAPAA